MIKRMNFRKVTSLLTLVSILALSNFGSAFAASSVSVTDDKNGNWADQHVILNNTPEADLMVRTGDIDNLGFGWPNGFDPFSGNITPWHSFPWSADENDAQGTDRIFVVSSYNGNPPHGTDGYTNDTKRPDNIFKPIELSYKADDNKSIKSVVIQAFVDDFQAPVWGAKYVTNINGVHTPFIDDAINSLAQTGPVGNLITVNVPNEYLYLFEQHDNSGNTVLSLNIDDNTTGAGDGYAVDFVKLLIDYDKAPVVSNKVTITGKVTDGATGNGIADAVVSADGGLVEARTALNGMYTLKDVPAGIVDLKASATGYGYSQQNLNVKSDSTVTVNFSLLSYPQLLPGEIHVDKNALSDISTSVYGGGKLYSITNGSGTLIPEVDYKLSGNTVTISKWYLNYYFTKFPEQNLYLTFNLDNGMSIRFTVYTGSSPYVVLTPDNVSYEMNSVDVKLNLTLNGNYIASIKNGSTSLVQRVDYTYGPSEKILYIRKGFLANYFSKTLMPLNLTVNFTGGESKTVMVTPYTKDLEIHSAYISAEVYNHPYYILFAPGHSDSLNISKEDVTENEKQLDRHFITYVNNGETIKIKSVVEAAYDNSANGFYGKITENNFSKSDDHTFSVLPASASDAKLYFVRKDGMAVQLSTIKESSQGTSYPMSTDCKVIRVTIKYDKSGIDITTLTDIESINKGDKVFCVMVDGLIKAIYFLR